MWRSMTISSDGYVESQEYDGAIEDCNFLLEQMNLLRVSDGDREAFLTKAPSNLRTGELDQTYDLIQEMGNRMRAKLGMPAIPKQERILSGKRYRL